MLSQAFGSKNATLSKTHTGKSFLENLGGQLRSVLQSFDNSRAAALEPSRSEFSSIRTQSRKNSFLRVEEDEPQRPRD